MTHSATEIAALAQKAARGAGFPAAQAEHFGRVAALHLGAGRDEAALLDALQDPSDSAILRLPLLMDDVLRAVALAGKDVSLSLHPGDEHLVLSYARWLPMRLTACAVRPETDSHQARLELSADPAVPARPALPARISASPDLMETMGALAAKTYVPATEASRSAGAGAGDIDND
ncbi:hypothetical protein [Thalassococcus lentus]|uniref:Type II secretion system protein GspE N-terminal domain-containing protein n=1 Tax=Thalassococcus lentus TaxID=1210524 RepID=A0ABT4XW39_9RHOB|nr:hypothetical protein [Thalassococcus lentus]MDA7426184.1 hypothetical protein [Thalassococcus lentus]